MYSRILTAIDGSGSARRALDEALTIAQTLHATLTVVWVMENTAPLLDMGSAFIAGQPPGVSVSAAAVAALDEARKLFALRHVRGVVRAVDSCGKDIATVVAEVAAECGAELVVMGTQGRHGMQRVLLGSVAESFLRISDMPVLLVRHDPDTSPDRSKL